LRTCQIPDKSGLPSAVRGIAVLDEDEDEREHEMRAAESMRTATRVAL